MTASDLRDAAATLAFIRAQQDDPATRCQYAGTDSLESDLADLDQPWTETARVVERDGDVVAAAAIEWDEDLGRSWVYGPWFVDPADGRDVLLAVLELAPVDDHEMYVPVQNVRVRRLAEELGWRRSSPSTEYEGVRADIAGRVPDGVRRATAADLGTLQRLHSEAFPGTYASADELVGPSRYTTLVATDGDAITGYVAGLPQDDDLYLDFVAVEAQHRGRGIGGALVRALCATLPGERVRLTVDDAAAPARHLYEGLGFRVIAESHAYRSPR